jgi:nucleoside-diphosphate-sugar epimerase
MPAAWITEEVAPIPRNIYGVTKVAAEDLCELFHRNERLACLILRTSRFFPKQTTTLRCAVPMPMRTSK